MPGRMQTEMEGAPALATSREPKGPKRSGDAGTMGDTAFKDAVMLIIGAWAFLLLLGWSLRGFNI